MRMLSAAAVVVLLTVPAYAQTPNINLMPEFQSKTPEEKEADAILDTVIAVVPLPTTDLAPSNVA